MTPLSIVKRSNKPQLIGFTLVEMMVAVLVASVLVLILMQFVQIASSTIVSEEDRLYTTNDIQAAMDLVATDLQSVRVIQMPNSLNGTAQGSSVEAIEGFGNGTPANTGIALTALGTTHPVTANIYPMDLYLLATPPAGYNTGGSALSEAGTTHLIRYKLAWQDPTTLGTTGTNPVMALYRDYVSSSATFGFGASSSSELNNSLGITGLHDLYTNYWSKTSGPPVSDFLVSNVFDFQILLYDVGSSTPNIPLNSPINLSSSCYYQPTINNAGQTFHISSQGLFVNSPNPSTKPILYSNLVAEIRMTLLNQQGVTIFNTGSLDLGSAQMSKYAHVYVRRVPISL